MSTDDMMRRTFVHYLTQGGTFGEEGEAEAAVDWLLEAAEKRAVGRILDRFSGYTMGENIGLAIEKEAVRHALRKSCEDLK